MGFSSTPTDDNKRMTYFECKNGTEPKSKLLLLYVSDIFGIWPLEQKNYSSFMSTWFSFNNASSFS